MTPDIVFLELYSHCREPSPRHRLLNAHDNCGVPTQHMLRKQQHCRCTVLKQNGNDQSVTRPQHPFSRRVVYMLLAHVQRSGRAACTLCLRQHIMAWSLSKPRHSWQLPASSRCVLLTSACRLPRSNECFLTPCQSNQHNQGAQSRLQSGQSLVLAAVPGCTELREADFIYLVTKLLTVCIRRVGPPQCTCGLLTGIHPTLVQVWQPALVLLELWDEGCHSGLCLLLCSSICTTPVPATTAAAAEDSSASDAGSWHTVALSHVGKNL